MPVPVVVITIGKAIGAAALTVATTKILPIVIDKLSDKVDDAHEMKKNWIKVPHVISANLSDAQNAITAIGLNSLAIEENAKIVYRKLKANTVVASTHKPDTKVDPTTTITLHYVSQETIDESQQMFDAHEALKRQHKEERQEKIANIKRRTKEKLSKIPINKGSGK